MDVHNMRVPNELFSASLPVFYVCRVLGLAPYSLSWPPRVNHGAVLYSILLGSLLTANRVYWMPTYLRVSYGPLDSAGALVQNVIAIGGNVALRILTLCQARKMIKAFMKLSDLEAIMPLNSKNYSSVYRINVTHSIILVSLVVLDAYFELQRPDLSVSFTFALEIGCEYLPLFDDLMFFALAFILLTYVRNLHITINKELNGYIVDGNNRNPSSVVFYGVAYDKIHSLSFFVNSIFSIKIIIKFIFSIVSITNYLHHFGLEIGFVKTFSPNIYITLSHLFFFAFCVYPIVGYSAVCGKISEEASHTALLIHRLYHSIENVELRGELHMFSIQLLHQKIFFTACGLFKLNKRLLTTIFGTVATYLIILIQFQMSTNSEVDCRCNKTEQLK